MQKGLIPGRNGYDIPFIGNATGTEKLAVIVIHGFGGSKGGSSTTATAVDSASAVMPLSATTVTLTSPESAGYPVAGSSMWWRRLPPESKKHRS
jgi:hypothetical protein